jgi:hypothetical protein
LAKTECKDAGDFSLQPEVPGIFLSTLSKGIEAFHRAFTAFLESYGLRLR